MLKLYKMTDDCAKKKCAIKAELVEKIEEGIDYCQQDWDIS